MSNSTSSIVEKECVQYFIERYQVDAEGNQKKWAFRRTTLVTHKLELP